MNLRKPWKKYAAFKVCDLLGRAGKATLASQTYEGKDVTLKSIPYGVNDHSGPMAEKMQHPGITVTFMSHLWQFAAAYRLCALFLFINIRQSQLTDSQRRPFSRTRTIAYTK